MSIIQSVAMLGAAGQATADLGDVIEQSLRFRKAQYLQGPLIVGSLTGTQTWSIWFKRGNLQAGVHNYLTGSRTNGYGFGFNSTYPYQVTSNANTQASNEFFRDPSAWYHLVVSGNSTSTQQWINGVELTGITTLISAYWTAGDRLEIGALYSPNSGFNFDGYMADVHMVDGQALQPTTFGRFNADGVWVPKTPTISSYGTNGFHLTFDPTQTNGVGHDSSGQGNHFTATGFTTTAGFNDDVVSDTPTNNYATLNSILSANNQTLSNGNLTGGSLYNYISLTTQIPDYAYYWESTGSNYYYGIAHVDTVRDNYLGSKSDQVGWFNNGSFWVSATSQGTLGPSFSTTDVAMEAYDPATGKYWVGKNGTWHGSGDPATGANPAYTVSAALRDKMIPASNVSSGTSTHNYGQQTFSYTIPSGFKVLATENLSEPTIKDGSEHFRAITDTGANILSTAQTAFSSGLWWIKDRANTNDHQIVTSLQSSANTLKFPTSYLSIGNYTAPAGNSVAWCWNYNSANPAANGFDLVNYTGNNTQDRTVNHGLGAAPDFILIMPKTDVTATASYIPCYHGSLGETQWLAFSQSAGALTAGNQVWGTGGMTATTFGVDGRSNYTNETGKDYIAALWTAIPGYSAFGSYDGNSSTDGPFVYTGFRPAFVMIKQTTGTADWRIFDSTRSIDNPITTGLYPNTTGAESSTNNNLDFLSNGFKLRVTTAINASTTYVYAAFAENPFGGENTAPATAR